MKDGSKVVSINIYFLLPDDFNGDLNDALEEIVKYRKDNKHKEFSGPDASFATQTVIWNGFQEAVDEGYKLHGAVALSELKGTKWNKIK